MLGKVWWSECLGNACKGLCVLLLLLDPKIWGLLVFWGGLQVLSTNDHGGCSWEPRWKIPLCSSGTASELSSSEHRCLCVLYPGLSTNPPGAWIPWPLAKCIACSIYHLSGITFSNPWGEKTVNYLTTAKIELIIKFVDFFSFTWNPTLTYTLTSYLPSLLYFPL